MTELERRAPADLDPWRGVGVVALHSHTAEQPCDDRCTVYDRRTPDAPSEPPPPEGRGAHF